MSDDNKQQNIELQHRLITIMFLDIESFTSMVERVGDHEASNRMNLFNNFVTKLIQRDGVGTVHKYIGDAIMATYDQPSVAISRSLEIQRELENFSNENNISPVLKVRIGLHLGELLYDESGESELIGRHVNCAARVTSAADGGQILVTSGVYESSKGFTFDIPSNDLKWASHGEFYLKGIGPMELYEVVDSRIKKISKPLSASQSARESNIRLLELSGYKNLKRIGEGSMGIVYKAESENKDEKNVCAIKVLRGGLEDNQQAVNHFSNEARTISQLKHHSIVEIRDIHCDTTPRFFAMDWVEGTPITSTGNDNDWKHKASLLSKVCDALAFAHEHEIVHRDLKPSNILVTADEQPMLLDFGLCISLDIKESSISHDTSSGISGTPKYLSPEQAKGETDISKASDIYSLGIVFYELLTGVVPFSYVSFHDILDAHINKSPNLLTNVNPDIPDALQRICLKAMEKLVEERYLSVEDMKADLERFLSNEEVRVRPSLYNNLIEVSAKNHVNELDAWHDKKLITEKEHVSLRRAYSPLLRTGLHAIIESRLVHASLVMLYLGGWLILNGATIWLFKHWGDGFLEDRGNRIFISLLPAIVANVLWAYFHWRGRYRNAFVMMTIGVLSLPIAFGVLIYELVDAYEIVWLQTAIQWREGWTPMFQEPLANIQLFITFSLVILCSSYLAIRSRTAVSAAVLSIYVILLYLIGIDFIGLSTFFSESKYADLALYCIPLVGILVYMGYMAIEKLNRDNQSIPVFITALIIALLISQVIAIRGAQEWYFEPALEQVDHYLALEDSVTQLTEQLAEVDTATKEDSVPKEELIIQLKEAKQKLNLADGGLASTEAYQDFIKNEAQEPFRGLSEALIGCLYLILSLFLRKHFKIEAVHAYSVLLWIAPIILLGGIAYMDLSWPEATHWPHIKLLGETLSLPIIILLAMSIATMLFASRCQSFFYVFCGLLFTAYTLWCLGIKYFNETETWPIIVLATGFIITITITYKESRRERSEDITDVGEVS